MYTIVLGIFLVEIGMIETMKVAVHTKGSLGAQPIGKLGTVMAKDSQTVIISLFDSSVYLNCWDRSL